LYHRSGRPENRPKDDRLPVPLEIACHKKYSARSLAAIKATSVKTRNGGGFSATNVSLNRPGLFRSPPPARENRSSPPLGGDATKFREAGGKSEFLEKLRRIFLAPADRPPNERNRKTPADKTRHPIIGESQMVGDFESDLTIKRSGSSIGHALPKIIIKMLRERRFPEWFPEERNIQIGEMEMGRGLFPEGSLDPLPIPSLGDNPDLMKPADLPDKIPA
jgi:hypothetical protein